MPGKLQGTENMTPAEFIAKWRNNPLNERAGAQAHFLDLCDLLGVDKPIGVKIDLKLADY